MLSSFRADGTLGALLCWRQPGLAPAPGEPPIERLSYHGHPSSRGVWGGGSSVPCTDAHFTAAPNQQPSVSPKQHAKAVLNMYEYPTVMLSPDPQTPPAGLLPSYRWEVPGAIS